MFDNRCHDAIRMYECSTYHRRRTAFPNLTCSFPNPLCIGLVIRIHLKQLRMSFAHRRKHLEVKYISVRALGVRWRKRVTVMVSVRVRVWVRLIPGGPGVPTSIHAYRTPLVASLYKFYLYGVRRYPPGGPRPIAPAHGPPSSTKASISGSNTLCHKAMRGNLGLVAVP